MLLGRRLIDPPLLSLFPLLDQQLDLASEQFGQHLDIFLHEDAVRMLNSRKKETIAPVSQGRAIKSKERNK